MSTSTDRDLSRAIREWSEIVSADHVVTDPSALGAASTATFATSARVPLILRPADRQQVQACLRVANAHRVPVYPISTGRNWGYGSRVPAADGSVLLDLSRMNRIVDFSEDLAYVTVEPGVTQQQLFDFLRDNRSRLWMDATGARPDCSLIGNTLERGFGHTPYGDHFAHVCGFEVVMPDGECIETGFSRFAQTSTGPLYRWGLGPTLDGLFTQSNFGIVTRMSIWLMPAPEHFEAFFFRCDDDSGLGDVLDALRRLRLNGTLRSAAHIGNDYKVLNGIGQYPWELTAGTTPLRSDQMAGLRKKLRFGAWNGSGGLYGTSAQVREAKRLMRRELTGKVAKLEFLGERKLELARRFARPYGLLSGWDISAAIDLVRPIFSLLKGEPTAAPMATTYWRKRTPPPADMDPDRDRCGLLWCAPVAPLEARHGERLTRLSIDTLLAHGFEPMLSLSLVTDRALTCVVSICYDRDVPGEDDRAMRCYRELLDRLTASGYHSYRLGIQSSAEMADRDSYATLLAALKRALDPNGILAPGRYGIE
jgi:4-cresol dehydrogenase (hydroxylating)